MMKFKEQIMQIVLKAEYYQVKQKCKMVEVDFFIPDTYSNFEKKTFSFSSFRAIWNSHFAKWGIRQKYEEI